MYPSSHTFKFQQHADSVKLATVVLTNSPPSTCRCFWDSQEGEAGSTPSQKLLGLASEEEEIVQLGLFFVNNVASMQLIME